MINKLCFHESTVTNIIVNTSDMVVHIEDVTNHGIYLNGRVEILNISDIFKDEKKITSLQVKMEVMEAEDCTVVVLEIQERTLLLIVDFDNYKNKTHIRVAYEITAKSFKWIKGTDERG